MSEKPGERAAVLAAVVVLFLISEAAGAFLIWLSYSSQMNRYGDKVFGLGLMAAVGGLVLLGGALYQFFSGGGEGTGGR